MDSFSLNAGTINLTMLLLLLGIVTVMLLYNSYSLVSNRDKILAYYNLYLFSTLLFGGWFYYKLIREGSLSALYTTTAADQLMAAISGLAYIYFFGNVFELQKAKRIFMISWWACIFNMYLQVAYLVVVLITKNLTYFDSFIWIFTFGWISLASLIILVYAIILKKKSGFQKIILTGAILFYLLIFVANLQELNSRLGLLVGVNVMFIALVVEQLFFAAASSNRISSIYAESEKLKVISYQYQLEIEQITNFFSVTINQQNTINDMLWDVSKNLIGKLGFEDCMIYLWNKDKTVLLQRAGYGIKGSMQIEMDETLYHIPKGMGIVGAAVESRNYILVNDTTLDKRYFSVDGKTRLSELCVPIVNLNEVIGAINTEHSEKNFYTDRHLQILTTIASMLADKIERIEAQRQTREKEIEVLKLSRDVSEWQLSALRSQMNPHFIFNAMNSIQQFTLEGDTDNANRYISKFSTLLRKVLKSSQQRYITVEDEIEQLRLYLDIEQLRMGDDFSYVIRVDDEIETDACKIPGMLIQPFAENALKHGLGLKEGKKKLEIHIRFKDDKNILVSIIDNGIGRKKAATVKAAREKLIPHDSKGILLIKERLLLVSELNEADIIAIEDLEDADRNPIGTKISIVLPVVNS